MAMILQVIVAVCCLVEIISTLPLPNNTTIEIMRLNRSLSDVCRLLQESNPNCGKIPKVDPVRNSKNMSEMCSGYRRVFDEVVCALNVSNINNCGHRDKIKELRTSAAQLSHGNNVTCVDRERNAPIIPMKAFCLELLQYVDRLLAKCLNGTKK